MQNINDYANSMFRTETLHNKWIDSCAEYINFLFSGQIKDKVVLDYAFGRGNWSLAFLKAGAAKVISVDASETNVERFKFYCTKNNIDNINIVHGNILEEKLSLKADILWIYGILPVIEKREEFLGKTKELATGDDSLFYIYEYNADSLRDFTVSLCRKVLVYSSEKEFLEDSSLFTRNARMRARDDLTAPSVTFISAKNLQEFLVKNNIYPIRQDIDFQEYLHKTKNEEFYPYQILCSLNPLKSIEIKEQRSPYQYDIEILKNIADAVFSLNFTAEEKKKISIGLFNTHFANLEGGMMIKKSLIEIFLYFMYILIRQGIQPEELNEPCCTYMNLCLDALAGRNREKYREILDGSVIVDFLVSNIIRI